jgi:hypothetical protein
MKRLFTLKYQNGQLFLVGGAPVYFVHKASAKEARDVLDAGMKVSIGPDHFRYNK